jgi:hypothetical protein
MEEKMVLAGKYEIPDKCPPNCSLRPTTSFSQGDICTRCPVLICAPCPPNPKYPEYDGMRVVEPDEFRPEWAEEWEQFFRDGTFPEMRFEITEK